MVITTIGLSILVFGTWEVYSTYKILKEAQVEGSTSGGGFEPGGQSLLLKALGSVFKHFFDPCWESAMSPYPASCSETAASSWKASSVSVPADNAACNAVTALSDSTACDAVMTAANRTIKACTYTAVHSMNILETIFVGLFAGLFCGIMALVCVLFALVIIVVCCFYGTCALLTTGACCLGERKKIGAQTGAVAISIEQPLLGSVQQ
jgi:hypothetical protein